MHTSKLIVKESTHSVAWMGMASMLVKPTAAVLAAYGLYKLSKLIYLTNKRKTKQLEDEYTELFI